MVQEILDGPDFIKLAHLAQDYAVMACSHDKTTGNDHLSSRQLVSASIRLYEAIFQNKRYSSITSPIDQANWHFEYALLLWSFTDASERVSSHLTKTLLISQKTETLRELQLQVYDLQFEMALENESLAATRQILKNAIEKAKL